MKHLFTTILLARPTGKPWLGVLLAALLAFPMTAALAQSGNAPANTFAPLTSATHSNLSVTDLNVSNQGRLIDNSTSNYATTSSGLGAYGRVRVTDNSATGTNVYPAGTYAGFAVGTGFSLFGEAIIRTYLNGTEQDEVNGNNILDLGNVGGLKKIGIITTKPFDAIEYAYSGLLSGATYIYYAEVKRFVAGEDLECNEPTALALPAYPMEVETYLSPLCLACSFTDTEYAIDNDPNTAAVLTNTVAVLASASMTISDQVSTYPANTFAGFDIETNSLLSIDVLSGIQISLLKDGTTVQTSPANLVLAGVGSTLVTDPARQRIGIVSNVEFDAVKINFNLPVSVSLGSVKIYGLVVEKLCLADLACNQTYDWSGPKFPTIINSQATGVTGLVSVGGTVADPYHVINGNNTEYATLSATAGVGGAVTLAVQDPIGTYPIGTTAGFAIDIPTGILKLNLLDNLTLSTYLDGALQETINSSQVLELTLLGNLIGGTPNDPYTIGFVAQKSFDEVRISINSLVSVLNSVRVYSAFIDTRNIVGAGFNCLNPAPDFNVTYPDVATTGDVSTNDKNSDPVTYGTPVADAGNPSGASLTMNSNGTYTFETTTPGVYNYEVPICLDGQSSGCATESLQITALDKNSTANLPVANPDYAHMKGADATPGSVIVDVTSNDGVGNFGGSLGTATIPSAPANGTATIDGNGNLVFTPTPGFYGRATVTYQVCESPSGLCATSDLVVNVLIPAASNTVSASDDYASVAMGNTLTKTAATGVISNDYDTNGATPTVTPQNTNLPGVGTLDLLADGSYTFTPVAGYTGPANFPYTVCDANSNCTSATLYILVTAVPNLTAAQFLSGSQLKADNSNSIDYVVAISNVGSATTNGTITFKVSKFDAGSGVEIAQSTGSGVTIFGTAYTLSNADFDVTSNSTEFIFTSKSGINIQGLGIKYIGFTITRTGGTAGTIFNTVTITNGSGGGEVESANNVISNPVTKL
ncbi:hypothetical protein CLV98_102364 [Dyadobacter jejuensis]|uniref:Tandem-95 repeat protein n=1 Tax=Dyadobacter jejuensis TaxID=1082580 RepID=A0A316ARR3_9BACT|nr:Ig-like domain-containing protein [Dyadobacter jejuensis]PWJ59530.1 hypothetical protein CLV98_102364 [Dyadobacter jejuensis]